MKEPIVVESVTSECQLLGRAHESSSARAEQLIACLEGEISKRDARISELEGIVDKAWNRSHQLEHGAYIPGALDAWKRPVLQNLPYDFSGNPGTPATQYCNGWNDAGGYWKAHADYLADQRDQLAGLLREVIDKPRRPTLEEVQRIDSALAELQK